MRSSRGMGPWQTATIATRSVHDVKSRSRLVTRHPSDARPVLRELLEAPIRFTPILEEHRRGYRFEGAVTVGEMLHGTVLFENLRGNTVGVPGQN